jgi:nitrate reductase delta subunit
MLGSPRKSPEQLRAFAQVESWTRERFSLDHGMQVLVSEIACSQPGCPPLETIVAFWTAPGERHHFKVFKPVDRVVPDDLPYAWQKPTLRALAGEGGDCC